MVTPKKVIKFLEEAKVKYEMIGHRTVYTAYDKAATLRVPPKIVGKTLVLNLDRQLVLVLIPANKNLDKNKLKKAAKVLPTGRQTKKVDFVSERVIKNKLKGVKVGVIPPFGSLWKLPTFVDRSLTKKPKIIINGGDYNWSIKINPTSFKKLFPETLVVGSFTKNR